MDDTEYSVIDTNDTTSNGTGIGIDYWLGIVRYYFPKGIGSGRYRQIE